MTRRDPAAGLGTLQRYVLLIMADGDARTLDRIETDGLLTAGRARGAVEGLARRGLADRQWDLHERGASYFLTGEGQAVANRIHGLDDEDQAEEDRGPRCPHGRPLDWPCKDCRTGPWRCATCGEVVRGGYRSPHQRDAHDRRAYPATTYTWAGEVAQ